MVYRKVFCLGLQKTCLTSLLKLMRQEGYDATGRDHQMMKNFHRGHYREISDFYERHDFFCDYPTPLLYNPIFERYGKAARYILSMRTDAETWYASLLRHNEYAHPVKHKHKNVFGRFYPHGFAREHKAYYKKHNSDIQSFFEHVNAADSLLVIRPDVEDVVPQLEAFLEREFSSKQFPHQNKSSERIEERADFRWRRHYNRVATRLYASIAPRLFLGPPRRLYPLEAEEVDFGHPAARQRGLGLLSHSH